MRLLAWFENCIKASLLLMMALIVLLTTIDLGWLTYQSILAPPVFRVGVSQLVELFSAFLLVLIGVELLETIKAYLSDRTIHVEVILLVGLVAITRKVILLEPHNMDGLSLIGIAAIVMSLAGAYHLIRLNNEHSAK
ncbi:MAG: phosphate-starvation-inducible PsiE family protein [Pseudomonadota bacterium]